MAVNQNKKTAVKIENKSLGSKVANIISDRIIEGYYSQGFRLLEENLSNELEVSRACIREAFMTLEAEGLVKRTRNKHTEVVRFEKQDIEEIYMLRLAIEKLCAETCIKNNTIPMEKLRKQMLKVSILNERTTQGIKKWIEADIDFHEIIVVSANNKRAQNVWFGLKNQIKTLLYALINSHSESLRITGAMSHKDIIKAFELRDINTVNSVLDTHIITGRDSFFTEDTNKTIM